MSINAVIDIYHGDEVSSFSDVKAAGVAGVIHKAGTGVDAPDSAYVSRKPEALAEGLMWGAHHFGTGAHPGKDQAESFLSIVNPGPTDLVALDFEENPSGSTMTLEGAPADPKGKGSPKAGSFVIYDPHNRSDYADMLEDYLNTFDGIDLASYGYPGHDASTALHRVFGA